MCGHGEYASGASPATSQAELLESMTDAAGMPVVFLDPYNGGLSAARALDRHGERVVVVAGAANAHTARTRGVEGRVVKFEPGGEPWLRTLESLARRGPHVVLTGGEVASAWLAATRDALPPQLVTFEAQDDAHSS